MPPIKHQAGCLPVEIHQGHVRVLLVTSRYTGEWIAPKGGIDPGETPQQAAERECAEEAGVTGRILGYLGQFDYPRGRGIGRVATYVLWVEEQLESWEEQDQRLRRWFSLDLAEKEVHRAEVLEMLRSLREALHAKKIILTR